MQSQTNAFSHILAMGRRVVAINMFMMSLLFVSLSLIAGKLPERAWLGIGPAAAAFAWLVLDASVTWSRFRRVRKYLKGDSFVLAYFRYGIRSAFLKEGAQIIQGAIAEMHADAELPAAKRIECERLIESGNLTKALAFYERVLDGVERKKRRESGRLARNQRKSTQLVEQGRAIGVPESVLRASLDGNDVAGARALIARQADLNGLLSRAVRAGCSREVTALLAEGRDSRAQGVVALAESIIARGRNLAVNDQHTLRQLISAGVFEEAEALLENARRRAEAEREHIALQKRVEKLPPHLRPTATALLNDLVLAPYGTRNYRKAKHALERELEG
ncbi:MAG: hypothetical protein ACREGR_01880 [Minisyncoccia bacterium]